MIQKTVLFVETTKLFISNSVRIFYLHVPGPLNSLICPGRGFFTQSLSQGERRLLPSSSRAPGVCPGGRGGGGRGEWFWMKLTAALYLFKVTRIGQMAPVLTEVHLKISEHKILSFLVTERHY